MQAQLIPVKTPAGQREVANRSLKLPSRARALLIMIHGNLTAGQVANAMRTLGDTEAMLDELAALGLIVAQEATIARTLSAGVAVNDGDSRRRL